MRLTKEYHICADDRGTLLVSLSTASAINDLHSILLNGAALYPVKHQTGRVDLPGLLAIAEEITIYRSSPLRIARSSTR